MIWKSRMVLAAPGPLLTPWQPISTCHSSKALRKRRKWKSRGRKRRSGRQYQKSSIKRFWRRRLDGIGLDTINKELLATGLHAVGQIKGWKVQQLVFVGGTCGSVHVESFNKNMKALGVLESKWDLIRQKLVRRLLEEQDKVLRSYFAQKGGARSQRGEGIQGKGSETCQVGHVCLKGKRRVYVDPS